MLIFDGRRQKSPSSPREKDERQSWYHLHSPCRHRQDLCESARTLPW